MVGGNRPGLTDQTASRRWLIRLGASEGAIRKRVARGTLRSKLGADGKRYVYLNGGGDEGAEGPGAFAADVRGPVVPCDVGHGVPGPVRHVERRRGLRGGSVAKERRENRYRGVPTAQGNHRPRRAHAR